MRTHRIGILPAAAVLIAIAACGDSITFPAGQETLLGIVVGIQDDNPFDQPNALWVKEQPDSPCGIVFRVTKDTDIGERQPDGSIAERRYSDIGLDYQIRVWSSGPVAESCPGQATATVIEIIPRLEAN